MFKPEEVEEPFGVGELNIDGNPVATPYLECAHAGGRLLLHWANSTLRAFYNDPTMDHLEYRGEDQRLQGIRLGRDIMDLMRKYEWPIRIDPLVDDATRDWFVEMEMGDLEKELDEL